MSDDLDAIEARIAQLEARVGMNDLRESASPLRDRLAKAERDLKNALDKAGERIDGTNHLTSFPALYERLSEKLGLPRNPHRVEIDGSEGDGKTGEMEKVIIAESEGSVKETVQGLAQLKELLSVLDSSELQKLAEASEERAFGTVSSVHLAQGQGVNGLNADLGELLDENTNFTVATSQALLAAERAVQSKN